MNSRSFSDFDNKNEFPYFLENGLIKYPTLYSKCNNSNNIRANLDDYFITKCGHTFHKKCLAKTIIMSQSLKCPICRTELKIIND